MKKPLRYDVCRSPLSDRWYAVAVTQEATATERGTIRKIGDVTDAVRAIVANALADAQPIATPSPVPTGADAAPDRARVETEFDFDTLIGRFQDECIACARVKPGESPFGPAKKCEDTREALHDVFASLRQQLAAAEADAADAARWRAVSPHSLNTVGPGSGWYLSTAILETLPDYHRTPDGYADALIAARTADAEATRV